MKIPFEVKPALFAAGAGAAALAIIGFGWGGWMTSGGANQMAETRSNAAVVKVLAPLCVNSFQQEADASANLTKLKATSVWQQADYVEKGGWATMVNAKSPTSGTARACAEMLRKLPG